MGLKAIRVLLAVKAAKDTRVTKGQLGVGLKDTRVTKEGEAVRQGAQIPKFNITTAMRSTAIPFSRSIKRLNPLISAPAPHSWGPTHSPKAKPTL